MILCNFECKLKKHCSKLCKMCLKNKICFYCKNYQLCEEKTEKEE
jgi:hypothetical protein